MDNLSLSDFFQTGVDSYAKRGGLGHSHPQVEAVKDELLNDEAALDDGQIPFRNCEVKSGRRPAVHHLYIALQS